MLSPFWQDITRGNEGGAAERSNSQTSLQTSHSWQEAKNICHHQNKI